MSKRKKHEESAITGMEKARHYAESHRKYARMMYGKFPKYVKSLGAIENCLEIGSGPATLTAMVAERNPNLHITAVDISSDMVAVAQEYVEEKKLQDRIRLIVADAADSSAIGELGQFDLVYSFFSLHHWDDPEKVICNLLKATADKGVLYIHDFKRVWWTRCLPLDTGEINAMRAAYTSHEIGALLRKLDVRQYEIRKSFPFFQSVIVTK